MTDEERDEEEEPERNGGLFDEPEASPAGEAVPEPGGEDVAPTDVRDDDGGAPP